MQLKPWPEIVAELRAVGLRGTCGTCGGSELCKCYRCTSWSGTEQRPRCPVCSGTGCATTPGDVVLAILADLVRGGGTFDIGATWVDFLVRGTNPLANNVSHNGMPEGIARALTAAYLAAKGAK